MRNLVLLVMMIALTGLGYAYTNAESYFTLWPSIDTRHSKDYKEQNFNQIVIGMSREDVDRLMGEPLRTAKDIDGSVYMYSYSADGGCKFCDFAWIDKSIMFEGDKVIEIIKHIHYN